MRAVARDPDLVAELDRAAGAVEALRRENDLLRTLVLDSPHGVVMCDAAGAVVVRNPAAERIWGDEPDNWPLARALATRAPVASVEIEIERADGGRGWILASAAPLVTGDGELRGAVSVFADVTRLKLVELELAEERRRQAIRLNDGVVQGLAVAKLAFDLGLLEDGRRALAETLTVARAVVTRLLGEPAALVPGDLRRP